MRVFPNYGGASIYIYIYICHCASNSLYISISMYIYIYIYVDFSLMLRAKDNHSLRIHGDSVCLQTLPYVEVSVKQNLSIYIAGNTSSLSTNDALMQTIENTDRRLCPFNVIATVPHTRIRLQDYKQHPPTPSAREPSDEE